MNVLRLQWAFLRRDWQYETSYRGMMILQLLGITGSLIIFYSIGRLVGQDAQSLEPYGGDYFSFALIGLVVSDFFNVGLRSFSNRLRLAQTTGTLEAMMATRASGHWIIACSGTWDFIVAGFRLIIALILGGLFLGVDFDIDPIAAALLAFFTLLSFVALGFMAAALILVIKRGDAVAALGNIFATAFAGALFPIEVLPVWIRWVAYLLPLHYALDGLRKAMLTGEGINDLVTNLIVLGLSGLILTPISMLLLRWAMKRVRADASLRQY